MCAIDTEEPLELGGEELLPHAAATRPSVQTPAVRANVLVIRLKETTLFVKARYEPSARLPGRGGPSGRGAPGLFNRRP